MIEKIIDTIENWKEIFKEKEYVCYFRDNNGFICEIYLTKKELYKFINEHQLADMNIYRIKDKLQIERELRIKEDKQC